METYDRRCSQTSARIHHAKWIHSRHVSSPQRNVRVIAILEPLLFYRLDSAVRCRANLSGLFHFLYSRALQVRTLTVLPALFS